MGLDIGRIPIYIFSMDRGQIRTILQAVVIAACAIAVLQADGDRGSYSGFGAQLNQAPSIELQNSQPTPRVTVTAYRPSAASADAVQVVDEEASVQFRLVGLAADAKADDYRVFWKFDEAHQGSDHQMLRPAETSTVNIRYNSNNSNHRTVELRVASADGHWTGATSFPVFGRADSGVSVAEGNVLLVQMKVKQTVH